MIDLRPSKESVQDDPLYFVGVVPADSAPSWLPTQDAPHQCWVPERVMEIIVGTAQAYGAQFPSRLGQWEERTVFNAEQSAYVADEVSFVGSVLDDDLVRQFATAISSIASRVAASSGRSSLAFEGP